MSEGTCEGGVGRWQPPGSGPIGCPPGLGFRLITTWGAPAPAGPWHLARPGPGASEARRGSGADRTLVVGARTFESARRFESERRFESARRFDLAGLNQQIWARHNIEQRLWEGTSDATKGWTITEERTVVGIQGQTLLPKERIEDWILV